MRGRACILSVLVAAVGCGEDAPEVEHGNSGSGGALGTSSTSTTATAAQTGSSSSSSSSSSSEGTDASSSSTTASTTSSGTSSSEASTSGGLLCNTSCGNGVVECLEDCDCGADDRCTPEELDFQTCVGLSDPLQPDVIFTGGTLGCNRASCRFDFSGCESSK